MNKIVTIFGGSGMVGCAITQEFTKLGYQVRIAHTSALKDVMRCEHMVHRVRSCLFYMILHVPIRLHRPFMGLRLW
jgi:NAD(P)-dependent dehydrogenase (short-subunit alcohol dehydrogenase family)